MQQLSPVEDVSDPLNTTRGNPDLKPIYTNEFRLRVQNFNTEKQSALVIFGDGSYTINDVVSKTVNDLATGKKTTTYENINGNYRGNLRIAYNTPLPYKKLSLNNMVFGSYANTNSYIDESQNTNKALQLQERLALTFRSDPADFGLNGSITYRKTANSLSSAQDVNTCNYGVGANTTLYLPYNFKVETDLNYSTNSGYTAGYEQEELLWNASISKSFLKGNAATVRLKMYDILKDRSNITYTTTANYTRYSEYNTLSSYFMLHFIYTFSIFSGGASATDMRRDGPPDGGGGRPVYREGGGGGGGRPPM
jgi:hypothetical protein